MTALALEHAALPHPSRPTGTEPAPGAAPVRPVRPARPRLRLVTDLGPESTGGVAVRARPAPMRPALRLTRRGRLLRTLFVAFVLAGAALTLAARLAAPGPLEADHATTVRPGQTLGELAAEQLPGVPVADGVAMITRLNGLSSPEVAAGRTLLVPAA